MDSINSGLNELLKVVAAGAIAVVTAWVRAWMKKEVEKRHLEAIEHLTYNAVVGAEHWSGDAKGQGGSKFERAINYLEPLFPSSDRETLTNAIEVAHREAGLEHPKDVAAAVAAALDEVDRRDAADGISGE